MQVMNNPQCAFETCELKLCENFEVQSNLNWPLRCHSLSRSGTVAVALLLVGQVLRVPVQRRQLIGEPKFHELHEPGEAPPLEGPPSLRTQFEDRGDWLAPSQITVMSETAGDG